jgi:hypothetical protein
MGRTGTNSAFIRSLTVKIATSRSQNVYGRAQIVRRQSSDHYPRSNTFSSGTTADLLAHPEGGLLMLGFSAGTIVRIVAQ